MATNMLDRISPSKVFLVDGFGALLTAVFIHLLATFFIDWVGLPVKVLRILTLVALMMAVYSFCCHLFGKGNNSKWLRVIMVANLVYIMATAIILVIYRDQLKWPGLIYFLSEFVVVFILVRWEAKIAISH